MIDPTADEIHAAAEEAIGVFLARLGNDFSTSRFVILAECIDEDGRRPVWSATGRDQQAWETLGLLMQGVQREQAALTADYLDGD
jgi:hypothetical protein